jgi:multidrug efflux pump subunit AcrA (membrane-fusion protein)
MATVPVLPSQSQAAAEAGRAGPLVAGRDVIAGAPDPQLVADMKHEIRALVEEIGQLASQDISPGEFFAGFLRRVVAAMGAAGGAVWMVAESGKLKLEHQIHLRETGADDSPQARTRHGSLLKGVLVSSQATLVPPNSGHGSEVDAGNPTALLLVISPLVVEKDAAGLIEIFQRPGGGPSTQRGYLRFLAQMAEMACNFLKSRRLRQLGDSQTLWRQLEEMVREIHRSLGVQETAYAIVNEGRRMIGCDRVSLALAYGQRCRIEAVSGLDTIDRRAAEARRLARLAEAVLRIGEPVWAEGEQKNLPPQIQEPLQEYLDESHARLVAVLPLAALAEQDRSHGGDENGSAERHGGRSLQRPIGALIIEQLRDGRASETLRSRAEIAAQHSATAIMNAVEHSSVILLPLWRVIGRATWLLRGRTLPKTLVVLGFLIAVTYALAVVPTDFEVAARGKLQPAERCEVFAPLDGVVGRLSVQHGQVVEKGAVLAELTNTDLELQLAALIGKQTTNQERLGSVQRALLETRTGRDRLSPADESRLAGEQLELRQESQNIERELALLREKQRQLTVVAPLRGQVVTWKVRELLLNRPVSRGQGLLTLADAEGPWELELYLPERRLKHVQAVQDTRSSLDVTFALSSHPGATFHGRVVEIEQAAEVRGDEGNTVLVRVAVEKEKLPPLHDQTTVTAKLNCGRTSIGYAWFCDFVETVESKVLFWMP